MDTFHLWWEPGIADQVRRAGDRIVSYQVCDWITPLPADTLLARGMMGDGHIDFAAFTRSVAATGYAGDIEVEIFNADLWAQPPAEVVDTHGEALPRPGRAVSRQRARRKETASVKERSVKTGSCRGPMSRMKACSPPL